MASENEPNLSCECGIFYVVTCTGAPHTVMLKICAKHVKKMNCSLHPPKMCCICCRNYVMEKEHGVIVMYIYLYLSLRLTDVREWWN